MSHFLENQKYQFVLHPDEAVWSLFPAAGNAPFLEAVRMGVWYRSGKTRRRGLEFWKVCEITNGETDSPHGPLQQISLSTEPDAGGLAYHLHFALVREHPLFLWKLEVENQGRRPVLIDRLDMLNAPQVRFSTPGVRDLAFFSNGWQSWNFTGTYGAGDRFRRTKLGPLSEPMRINAGTPHPQDAGHFGSDMFAVLGSRRDRQALLAGFLAQREHFGSLECYLYPPYPSLYMWANGDGALLHPGSRMSTDWACAVVFDVDTADPLGTYVEAVARENGISPSALPAIPTGWTSWYHYYSKVSAEDIRRNLQAAAALQPEIPLKLIQIDDGFETAVGDWFSFKPSFPQGMAPLAAEIRQAGFTPGLWLAPFIVEPKSRLAKERRQWLLHDDNGRLVNAGFGFSGGLTSGLDLTHPDALAYAQEVMHTAVHKWGYPFLKLDFLYAGALPGRRHDPTFTRAQALRRGLNALRQAAGEETFLLGCGCPLGPALGLVDAMRISSDVSGRWEPSYWGIAFPFKSEPDFPAARNAVQNSLTRAPLHRRWWINDPDVLILRPETRLTLAEVQTLAAVIALSGGALLISDDLARLPPERLRIARQMLPLIGKRPEIPDWFDRTTPQHVRLDLENQTGAWHLVSLFNWADREQVMKLQPAAFGLIGRFMCREFWSGRTVLIEEGGYYEARVPPHGNLLAALRPLNEGQPQYLGSSLHISQGLEIAYWESGPQGIRALIERPGEDAGQVDLYLPAIPREIRLNRIAIPWAVCGRGHYRIQVKIAGKALLEIR